MNKRDILLIAVAMLAMAVLACNRTVPTATPQAETRAPATPTTESIPTVPTNITPSIVSPSPTSVTPTPATPTPTEGTPECLYDAEFVTDVTVPDDTRLEPGTAFAKTWRIRNSGTCAWEPGTLWFFDSGDRMNAPSSVDVPIAGPGNTADITVHLTAPETPGTYVGYWRLRRTDGEAFGARAYVRIIVVGEEATPTPSPTPTITREPGAGPIIYYFVSNVDEADPGDTITLEWETEGAVSATLYHLMPTGQLGRFWEVDVDGIFEYEIDVAERNQTRFLLVVSDAQENTTRATRSITLRCPDTWFFEPAPEECPAHPAIFSDGAEQHFEHGTMVWIREQDQIFVLFDDGQSPWWRAYGDEWDEGDPEDDPTLEPPAGLYQPVRGFGLVWREQVGVRDRLGWAVDLEAAFQTALQRTSRPRYNDIYIGALDGGVWRLLPESSGWEKIP